MAMDGTNPGSDAAKHERKKFTDEKPPYYLKKFQRRVYRQIVQFETLRGHLEETLKEKGTEISSSLGIPEDAVRSTEIRDHAEKSCLVGLKVEFELFLYIICHLVLDGTLEHVGASGKLGRRQKKLGDLVQNKNKFYERFVEGGLRQPTELFIEMAVPDYGLFRLLDLLKKCGLGSAIQLSEDASRAFESHLPDALAGQVEPWAQVHTAFQVRHAIEHAFSRVSKDFLGKARDHWPASSWRRHFDSALGPQEGKRLGLDDTDIRVTAAAMVAIAGQLAVVTSDLQSYLD
jgi:hypothetical protein